MEHRFTVDIDGDQARVFDLVADLSTYPDWLEIVQRAEPESPDDGQAASGTEAWLVTLRAKLGPLARSKQLRMVRTVYEPSSRVRFERDERDGRDHSPWVLESVIEDSPNGGTTLTMELSYGGRLWTSALNGVLDAQVEQATSKLETLASTS